MFYIKQNKFHKLITILIIITLLPWWTPAYAASDINTELIVGNINGDVDGNGIVDLEDSELITQYVNGQIDTLPYPESADATQDEKITMEDALTIAQKVNGNSCIVVVTNEYGLSDKIYIGSPTRIEVFEKFFPFDITSGTVRIQSASTGYNSGDRSLTFERDGRSLYYHWDTSGLQPASDYEIYVTLTEIVDTINLSILPTTVSSSTAVVVSLSSRTFEIPYLSQAQDAYAPAPGIAMEFNRDFIQDSSHAPYLGPFGRGWQHNFDIFLEEFTDGRVHLFGQGGFSRWFMNNGDGTYAAASPSEYPILVRDSDGTFQLIDKSGFISGFRSDLRLDYMQDPNGKTVTCIYNNNDQLSEIRHSNGLSFDLEYNAYGRISKLTDHVGRETSYDYSSDGEHLLGVTDSAGGITSYTYSLGQSEASNHRITSITYPDDTQRYYTFDSDGRVTSTERFWGVDRTTFSYDATGATHITDALGATTTVKVNERGQPIEIIGPDGSVTRYEYDSDFNLIKVTDPLNRIYTLDYDERCNVVQVSDPMGSQIDMGYEPNFNKIAWLQDSLGRITTFSYNGQGNLLSITYPDGSEESYTYDGDNRLTSKINRDGQVINYNLDDKGLLLSKRYPDGNSVNYIYDSTGRMTDATASTGTISFEYDTLDRLIKATYPGNRIFQYDYNAAGKRTRMIDPDGKILNYQYGGAGRLLKITDESGQLVVEYEYDNADRRTKRILGNGAYSTYEYDNAGQILRLVNYNNIGDIISYFNYTYDSAGNRLSKDTIEGMESYTYDAVNQLTGVVYPDGTTTEFVYDAMGNRQQVTENGVTQNYIVNNLNQYVAVNSTTYDYDVNGNLISKTDSGQTTYYDYDFENRLIKVRTPIETIDYTYNPFSLRNSRTDSDGTVRYLWDRDQVVIEESTAYSTIASYTWGNILDEAIQMERGGSSYYYAQDAMLSVSDLMDVSGNQVEHYRYRVFGEPLVESSFGNPWLFTGLAYDIKTGLQYNRFRYYSPEFGRFINFDPIGFSGGINLYSYSFNNPVNYFDPHGLLGLWGNIGIGALVGFGYGALQGMVAGGFIGGPGGVVAGFVIGGIKGGIEGAILTGIGYGMIKEIDGILNGGDTGGGGGTGNGGLCPTFVQLSPKIDTATYQVVHLDSNQKKLFGQITVPIQEALLRSDIPIFGVAGGNNFKEYQVEYGKGTTPTEWHLIDSSTTPQLTTDVGIDDMRLMQGDIDIRGNLATWNTGLKNWVHLPWHPPEDPTDLNGVYTLRLTVFGHDGEKVEDTMTVEVGRVIAQCLPGIAISSDERVVMRFPEQSLTEPFRLYTILPLDEVGEATPQVSAGIQLIGPAYRIREPGDRFIKDVTLEFNAGDQELDGRDGQHIGIVQYDVSSKEWNWADTVYSDEDNAIIFSTTLTELNTPKVIYSLGYDKDNDRSQLKIEDQSVESLSPISSDVLIHDTFEDDTGNWELRDRFVGAVLDRARAAPDGSYALKVTSQTPDGSFGVTALDQSFDVREYPILNFDYRISPGVKTDFYVLVNDRWYNLGFTDDITDFKNRDVNIANMGRIEGIVADDQWHSASVNLYEQLRQKTQNTQIDAIVMADWDVTGYMKLEFGNNVHGATYYIDNFEIAAGPAYNLADVIVVDDFDRINPTNLLGGLNGIYSSFDSDCQATIIGDIASENNNSVLQLSFDMSNTSTYGGYWTSLMEIDLDEMTEVSMHLYAPESVPPMFLGLRHRPYVEDKIRIQPYLSSTDEDGWYSVNIPLSAFNNLPNQSSMESLFLTFENQISSGEGIVLIDDIEFHNRPSYSKVFDFSFHNMEHNLLGGEFNTIEQEAAVISSGHHTDRTILPVTDAARISYGGNIGLDYGQGRFSYAIWETDLRGFDAREYQDMVLNIRGENGGEIPNIWLNDGTSRRAVIAKEITPITTSWQEIHIPLDKFTSQGIDISKLESIQIVFEWEEMSGTIYISEMGFDANGSIPTTQIGVFNESSNMEQNSAESKSDDSGFLPTFGLGLFALGLVALIMRKN